MIEAAILAEVCAYVAGDGRSAADGGRSDPAGHPTLHPASEESSIHKR